MRIGKNRWFDIKPTVQPFGTANTTGDQARTFVDALLDQILNFVELGFVHNGANMTAWFVGGAHSDFVRGGGRNFNRLVINAAFDQHTGGRIQGWPRLFHNTNPAGGSPFSSASAKIRF